MKNCPAIPAEPGCVCPEEAPLFDEELGCITLEECPGNQPSEDEGGESTNETGDASGDEAGEGPGEETEDEAEEESNEETNDDDAIRNEEASGGCSVHSQGGPGGFLFILLALGGWLGFHSSRKQRLGTIAGR